MLSVTFSLPCQTRAVSVVVWMSSDNKQLFFQNERKSLAEQFAPQGKRSTNRAMENDAEM